MDVSPYVKHHRQRIEAHRERIRKALAQALSDIQAMGPIFSSTPDLERVYLFGSLNRSHFREDSDIDLAVEGLSVEEYGRFRSRVQAASDFPVDIVDLVDCEEDFTEFVRRYARLIYERPTGAPYSDCRDRARSRPASKDRR